MKIKPMRIRKALITEDYLRRLARKTIDNEKLDYFKEEIIKYLQGQVDTPEPSKMEKAGYGIGTIREWKGRKYIKGPDKKWRRYYTKEDRGARISIKNLIKKVDAINSVEELMNLIMIHRDRFQDEYGHPIPIVQELSRYMKERQEKIAPQPSPEEKKVAFEKKMDAKKKERAENIMDGKRFKKIVSDLESGAISPLEARDKMKKLVKDEKAKNGGMLISHPDGGNVNIIDGVMNVLQEELNKHKTKENEEERKRLIENIVIQGVQITPQKGKYLFAIGPVEDGYFIVNGNLDYDSYSAIIKEAEKNGIKPPYHVYGQLEVYQDRKNIDFHKLAEAMNGHEKEYGGKPAQETEDEKRRNRSEAMRGNQNAKKEGVTVEPQTDNQIKQEQTAEKKARKKARQPTEKKERSSALKDSTWDPKSEDYRYKDTGYIAGAKKELASARIKKAAAAGDQVENNSIDWEGVEENSRLAETLITKANLFGKIDWEALQAGGMTGPAGFIVNRLYATIGAKPKDETPEGRFDYSRGLDSIRSRMEVCKTLDEVKQTMDEIKDEMQGEFVEAKQAPEYIKMAEKLKQIRKIEDEFKADVLKEVQKRDFFKEMNDYINRSGKRIEVTYGPEGKAESLSYYRSEGNPYKNKTFSAFYREGNKRVDALIAQLKKERGLENISDDRHTLESDINSFLYNKNKEIALTNTIAQAWGQLGQSFRNALSAVKYPGSSKTMAKHLEEAESMDTDDWAWSEKKAGGGGGKERKTRFELKVVENIVRKGGRDVSANTTEELKKIFNLRDVQSGNWVLNDPKSAKFHVDNIAMGLADLGDILGIPANLLSLNGRLAMAIGARGSGKALAHYEPIERVINITKMKGGGSLGHEWFHALDNMIAAAMTGGENWQIWLTEAGLPSTALTERQRKIKDRLDSARKMMERNPDDTYYKRWYESAKEKALKAKIPVFDGGPDEHIQKVKAAFGNLAAAMLNGSADAVQHITYTKQDYEDARKWSFSTKNMGSIDEVVQFIKNSRWKVNGSRDKALRVAVAQYDNNPEGGTVKAKTGEKTSAFYRGAQDIDGGSARYWSTLKELGARAFSAYIQDKLDEKGWENNYLTHATHNSDYQMDEGVYPEGEERKAINAAFDELFAAIRETGAIRKAIELENLRADKLRIVFLKKGIVEKEDPDDGDKLAEFKRIILEHLEKSEHSEDGAMEKAGLPVGTIRDWKGKKYVKVAPGKWRPKYDSHNRGAKLAIAAIKKKVDAAKTAKELMDIVMENRDRFSDTLGNPLPFVQELSKYVSQKQDYLPENITARRKDARSNAIKAGQKKEKAEKNKPDSDGDHKEWEQNGTDAFKAGKPRKPPYDEIVKPGTKIGSPESRDAGKKMEAWLRGWDRAMITASDRENDDSQASVDLRVLREKYQSGKSVEGDEDEIFVGDEVMKGRWKLVEADSPSASHDETTFNKTRGFPTNKDGSTINDRDYQKDRAAQEAVMSMGSNFDGRALSFDSPVVVSHDGIVISGNNRTMSSKIAARKGADTKYIDALKKRAAKFGFSGEDVERFRHPRVIFEIEKEGDYSTREFAKYNQESQKTMSPIEAAVKVAKTIKEETVKEIANHITEFDTLGELYADKKACMDIFNAMEKGGIINQFNRNSYIDTEGGVTGAGKEFMETVLLGSIVSEPNIRGLNREGCKHIRAKLVRAITPLINNKSMGGYSVMAELNQAIDLFMQFNIEKDKFGTLEDLAKQGVMFEEPSAVGIELARKMQLNQKEFADFMQKMNASLEIGASGQSDIFLGDVETKDEVLKRVLDLKKAIRDVLENMRKAKSYKELAVEGIKPYTDNVDLLKNGEKTIAVDFDGVINSFRSGWKGPTETDEPVLSAAESISTLYQRGYKIIIYSTRASTEEGVKTIREYLRKHTENDEVADNIEITDKKPIAHVYIDDRAISFNGNWEETLKQIEEFKPWTERKRPPVYDETGKENKYVFLRVDENGLGIKFSDDIDDFKTWNHYGFIPKPEHLEKLTREGIAGWTGNDTWYYIMRNSAWRYMNLDLCTEIDKSNIEKFKSWIDKSLTWSGHKLQGRAKVQGMDISIENKKGSVRNGIDKDGHEWNTRMNYDYGYIRGTVGKDKDHLDCVAPETKILIADYTEKPAKDIQVGDMLIASQENPDKRFGQRKQMPSKVVKIASGRRKMFRFVLSDGRDIKTTNGHLHYMFKGKGRDKVWRRADELKIGHELVSIYKPTEMIENEEYKRGYLYGAYKGDGSINYERGQLYCNIAKGIYGLPVIERIKSFWSDLGLETARIHIEEPRQTVSEIEPGRIVKSNMKIAKLSIQGRLKLDFTKPVLTTESFDSVDWCRGYISGFYDTDGCLSVKKELQICQIKDQDSAFAAISMAMRSIGFKSKVRGNCIFISGDWYADNAALQFTQILKPALFKKRDFTGQALRYERVKVVDIQEYEGDFVAIQTESGTYIANGLFTHNCYVGPDPDSNMVYVVHQNDPATGAYDEDKVMLGFDSLEEAKQAYLSQYDRPGFLGEIDAMDIENFKEKAFDEKNKGRKLK